VSRRRQLSRAASAAEIDDLIYLLSDNLGRADAFISTAEELIERPWDSGEHEDGDGDDDDDVLRRRNHVEHLIESAKLAVRAAGYTCQELKARAQRRRGA
jgi:hypothetical protein